MIEINDIVLVSPPTLSLQSWKYLGRVESLGELIKIDCLLYVDTKSESYRTTNLKFVIGVDMVERNFKNINLDQFMDLYPEFFI